MTVDAGGTGQVEVSFSLFVLLHHCGSMSGALVAAVAFCDVGCCCALIVVCRVACGACHIRAHEAFTQAKQL